MNIPVTHIESIGHLPIDKFREMDYRSIKKYNIPITLMMENAGLNLARLSGLFASRSDKVLIGVGKGNNGGGGLVAARRLAGWGYKVYLDMPDNNLNQLGQLQLKRALDYGVKTERPDDPAVFIDAYLGFSQRLPLPKIMADTLAQVKSLKCKKISLDIPSGFDKTTGELIFKPDIILTLAAMKTELLPLLDRIQIYIADLGLTHEMYTAFGISPIPAFADSGLVECMA